MWWVLLLLVDLLLLVGLVVCVGCGWQPMDLAKVEGKLKKRSYKEPADFISDMRLIFRYWARSSTHTDYYTTHHSTPVVVPR